MNKLALAAVAVTMSAGISSAGTLEVSNSCIVGHGVSTLHDGREVVELDSVNEMIACMVAEEAEKTAKEADRVVTYIAAWEEAKAKVIELIYEIAVLEAKLDDVDYGQNTQIQELAQYNADIKAELLKTATRMLNAEAALEVTQAELDELKNVEADLKKWQSWLSYWQPHAQNLEKHLRRAEDRIRVLEKELRHHRSGGYWNPTNW